MVNALVLGIETKTDSNTMPSTSGMKGEGYYDQHSIAQGAAIGVIRDWMRDAIANVPLPPESQPIAVLDLGSSEGRNAVGFMHEIVNSLRQRRKSQSLQTIYSDLPGNDFNRLFANLQESIDGDEASVGTYASAIAGSFYSPLVPPGTAHFITCLNAMLWFDEPPEHPVTDFVVYRRPRSELSVAEDVAEDYSRHANHDLEKFLRARAVELAEGGKLLLVTPGDDEHGSISEGLYDVFNDACIDLVKAGRIVESQYERLTMPIYFRDLEETLQPVQPSGAAVHDLYSVDRAEVLEVPTPFIVDYQQTGNREQYAEAFTGFIRAFSEPVVRAAWGREAEDDGVIEMLYQQINTRLQNEPERYFFRYIIVAVLLTRRAA